MNITAFPRRSRGVTVIVAFALLGAITLARAADAPLKPLFPGIKPVCPCEELAKVSLPNVAIDSAKLDPSNGWCRVTAIVTHPPTGDQIKVWIGLPVTNWNGRFQGNGGGGFSGFRLGGH
jgi:feruloyl esterase